MKLTLNKPALVLAVTPIGLCDLGAEFRINKPYTACRICGRVYQTKADREAIDKHDILNAMLRRRDWSFRHARTHPQWQHDQLEKSGAYMTPNAAMKLSSYGIISLSDMALDNESWNAGREAHRVPHHDAEGS